MVACHLEEEVLLWCFFKNGSGVKSVKQFLGFDLVAKVIVLFRYKKYFGEYQK